MAVTTAPILASPQDSEPFRIEADSSDFASRAILSQQLPGEDKWHPVAFYSKSKTVCSAEWSEDDGVLRFRGKIYIPQNLDLRRWIVSLCHDTKVAGHPGCWKTLELVSRNYWWPQMSRYIR